MYIPAPDSHKGQNGRLLVIGESLVSCGEPVGAYRGFPIVDLVHYCSVPENNEIVKGTGGV